MCKGGWPACANRLFGTSANYDCILEHSAMEFSQELDSNFLILQLLLWVVFALFVFFISFCCQFTSLQRVVGSFRLSTTTTTTMSPLDESHEGILQFGTMAVIVSAALYRTVVSVYVCVCAGWGVYECVYLSSACFTWNGVQY